jgi:anti-sigma B factor antagonist
MNLEYHAQTDVQVIKLPRRLIMADAKAAQKSLRSFTRSNEPLLALDMRETEFIDSSGLAVLVNCLQVSRRKNGEVCLFGMQASVRTLFELTRLNTIFPIEHRCEDAVQRLSS